MGQVDDQGEIKIANQYELYYGVMDSKYDESKQYSSNNENWVVE